MDRGEYGPVDVETLAQVIPAMYTCRVAVQGLPVTREYATALIDGVLLPAMRGAPRRDTTNSNDVAGNSVGAVSQRARRIQLAGRRRARPPS